MLCSDPTALLLVGGLSLIRFISLVTASVQSNEGMLMGSQASDSVSLGDHVGYSEQHNYRNTSGFVNQFINECAQHGMNG